MKRPDRAGFTLIEVLVGLTLGAVAVLLAHQTFAGALDAAGRLAQRRAAHLGVVRSHQELERLFGSMDLASPGARGFAGGPDQVRFAARPDPPAPAREVTVLLDAESLTVVSGGAARRLRPAAALGLDYLLTPGAESRWVASWHSPASAPLAVRLRLRLPDGTADTLLLFIGPRG